MQVNSDESKNEINGQMTYQLAKQEWDERIGSSRVQAKNWRFVALLSLLATVFSLLSLLIILPLEKNRVFIAEVTKDGRVINIASPIVPYKPNLAQEEYFLSNFIKAIRGLSLDPIVVKQNWLNAYQFLTPRGRVLLNEYFRQDNPVSLLGRQTKTIDVTDINPLSEFSFNLRWVETTVDSNGQTTGVKNFSGIFTITIHAPKTQAEILVNPLGIHINDFHISERI